jgi:hypothetical protein
MSNNRMTIRQIAEADHDCPEGIEEMTQEIEVKIPVTVTVDESKFTPEFLGEFREDFYNFVTVQDHIRHIAFLAATGQLGILPCFIEGYGESEDFGIEVTIGL